MTESELGSMSLGEIAYHRLHEDIVACRLAPGQRLTERQLAAATGLGISPIREALTRLDHEGLVSTLPRKGYQVKPLTIQAVNDVFDYWEFLGPEVMRRGVTEATGEQLDKVIAGFEKISSLVSEEPPSQELTRRVVQLTHDAFAALAEATNNEYIVGSCYQLGSQLARVWTIVLESDLQDSGNFDGYLSEIVTGIDIFARRDGQAAAEHARSYIQQSHRRVLRTLLRWPSVATAEVVPMNRPS